VRPDAAGGAVEVFVADRGAGRVVQIDSDKPGSSAEAISGFPVGAASTGSAPCAPGVQSLIFLDHARLVAAGGDANGKPLLRLYDLTESDGVLKADEFKQDIASPGDNEQGNKADSNVCLHNVARTRSNDRVADMLVMAASTDRGPNELLKVPVRANTLGDAVAFKFDKNEEVLAGTAGGIAISNDGYIVTANYSELKSVSTSELQFVSPIDGRVVLAMGIKLPRIVALAYHPTGRNLYAASFGGSDGRGGIYRIDDATEPGKPAAVAVIVADLARPTALSFGADGALYVTTLGRESNGNADSGALTKLTGEL
jgi:hypothetical protein